jgi:hypothetical protein
MSVCFLVVLDCRSNLEDALSRRGTQQPSHLHVSHHSGKNFPIVMDTNVQIVLIKIQRTVNFN